MARRRRDLTGERIGYVVALDDIGFDKRRSCRIWLVRCDCGMEFAVPAQKFCPSQSTDSYSCGCMKSESFARSMRDRISRGDVARVADIGPETYAEAAERLGLTRGAIRKRAQRGWSAERIASTKRVWPGTYQRNTP